MSITYKRDKHGGYPGVTDESPKGFRGIVFVGRGPEPEPEEVTVCDTRFPWEVAPQAPLRKVKPLIRDPVFQVAVLAGVIVDGLRCWWG